MATNKSSCKNQFKKKVRQSKEWKELRELKLKEQKLDPITGKKILKGANCHHKCLDVEQYDNLSPERFVLLNRQTHEILHWVYGDERQRKDWKSILKGLQELCEDMDKYNQ